MINVGVIGYGYWGPNLVRNFMEASGARVSYVADARDNRLPLVQSRYPTINVTTDPAELIRSPDVDAVAIATPVDTHFDLTMQALAAGKHVLVEKPMAHSSEACARMIEAAQTKGRVLMVDHTFVYTGAVRKIKELVDGHLIGTLYYYDSVRVNLGLFQHDVNVLWDLAVHDLGIMDYVLGAEPNAISATGAAHVAGQPADVAYLTCYFDNSLIAHFHVNWLAPVKIRRTLIGGDAKMIVFDDLEPSEKIKVYDKGITLNDNREGVYQMLVGYRTGDMWAPQLNAAEALRTEALHFVHCIEHGTQPLTDGHAGMRVVRVLEAADASLQDRGRLIELSTKA